MLPVPTTTSQQSKRHQRSSSPLPPHQPYSPPLISAAENQRLLTYKSSFQDFPNHSRYDHEITSFCTLGLRSLCWLDNGDNYVTIHIHIPPFYDLLVSLIKFRKLYEFHLNKKKTYAIFEFAVLRIFTCQLLLR